MVYISTDLDMASRIQLLFSYLSNRAIFSLYHGWCKEKFMYYYVYIHCVNFICFHPILCFAILTTWQRCLCVAKMFYIKWWQPCALCEGAILLKIVYIVFWYCSYGTKDYFDYNDLTCCCTIKLIIKCFLLSCTNQI